MTANDDSQAAAVHQELAYAMIIISLPIFITLKFFIPSPWGKSLSSGTDFGPLWPARLSWFLFESPNLFWSFWWLKVKIIPDPVNLFLLSLFVGHYIQRAIIYPILMSNNSKKIPFAVVLSAFTFCNINGYLQAQSLCVLKSYPPDYWYHPKFLLGVSFFSYGVYINLQSDRILRSLRVRTSSYQIPYGGWFELISAPHYFGEILEWLGFAIATQSVAAVAFMVFTAANLIPRGIAHHQWYQKTFKDYPRDRKAVIPFVW